MKKILVLVFCMFVFSFNGIAKETTYNKADFDKALSEGKVVVGENGLVEGTIECAYATISGGLKVNIKVNELLTLKSTANLVGEIATNKLQIEPGANFSGSCKMGAVIKGIENGKKEEREGQRGKTA